MKNQRTLAPITGKNKKKTQYLQSNVNNNNEDPHSKLTIEQKLALKPSDLVPQLANPTMKKRDYKMLEKDQQRERLRELEQERTKFEVSEAFEDNLLSGGVYEQASQRV